MGVVGVERSEVLTDGWLVPEGYKPTIYDAAPMSEGSVVQWDLGVASEIGAAALQADSDDEFEVLVSEDGHNWSPLWRVETLQKRGLRERTANDLGGRGRYVRLQAVRGGPFLAATELRLFCRVPAPWPPHRMTRIRLGDQESAIRSGQIHSYKIIFAGLGLVLVLAVVPRFRRKRWRDIVCGALAVASLFAWMNFGSFHGPRGVQHTSNNFHYYMGTKYFDELGYFDLYRCTGKALHELGRAGSLDHRIIRDLDTNELYPGWWFKTPEGTCRSSFSPVRWQEFKADVLRFDELMSDPPLSRALADHGYNATPLYTLMWRPLTSLVPPSDGFLIVLSQPDNLALLAMLAAIAWGFGFRAAAIAGLVLAVGHPWGYHWVGGSLGRHIWLVFGGLGLALLAKHRPFWGAASFTIAVLLRFFPLIFLGGLGLHVLIRWYRERRLSASGRAVLAGIAVSTVVGVVAPAEVNGWGAYGEFKQVIDRHSVSPGTNRLGFPMLLRWQRGYDLKSSYDPRLTDPDIIWKQRVNLTQKQRQPFRYLALVSSLVLIGWCAWRGAKHWETMLMAAPLLFSAVALSSYDYTWLLLMVPLVAVSDRRTIGLVGFAISTCLLALFIGDVTIAHLWYAAILFVLVLLLVVDFVRELSARQVAPYVPQEGAESTVVEPPPFEVERPTTSTSRTGVRDF